MQLPVEVHKWIMYLQQRKANRQKLKQDMGRMSKRRYV